MMATAPAPAPVEPGGVLPPDLADADVDQLCDFLLGWFDRTNVTFFPGFDGFDLRPQRWREQMFN